MAKRTAAAFVSSPLKRKPWLAFFLAPDWAGFWLGSWLGFGWLLIDFWLASGWLLAGLWLGLVGCRLRTTLLPRTSSQVVKPAQAGALTTPPLPESCRAASSALSLEGVSQMDSILPDRLLALVRPGNDLVLRRIRNLKRCVQACGCKIMTPRYACKMPRSCVSARRAKKKQGKKRKPARNPARSQPEASQEPTKPSQEPTKPSQKASEERTKPSQQRTKPSQKPSQLSAVLANSDDTLRVVRKDSLYYPNHFGFLVPKPCKTAKFFNLLNVFPMSPVFVTAPFLVQKALKSANSEKFVFSCQTSKVVPEPPSSLVFRRKPAPDVRAPNSVFCPEKPANSSPPSSSPLVTALSPLAFWVRQPAELVTTDVTAPSG